MPIDPSIPLAARAPEMPDPFGLIARVQQIRGMQQDARMREQQIASNEALEQDRRQQLATRQRTEQQTAQIDQLMSSAMDDDPQTGISTFNRQKFEQSLLQSNLGHLYPQMAEHLDKLDASTAKFAGERRQLLARSILAVQDAGNTPNAVMTAVAYLKKNGALTDDRVQPILQAVDADPSPEGIGRLMAQLGQGIPEYRELANAEEKRKAELRETNAKAKKAEIEATNLEKYGRATPPDAQHVQFRLDGKDVMGSFVPGPTGGQYLYNGEDVTARAQHIPAAQGAMSQMYAEADPKAIADAIIRGEREPDTASLGRPIGAAVDSVLAKNGYNKARALTDWKATQKYMASLNGSQQTRLRQSAETAYHSLDVIDSLADKWKGGRFPLLNAANLVAAKQGTYGKDVQSVATQLEAQISDLTSELGNVYMGGNSPTDHALSLAGKNLSADWSNDTLRDMTKLARTNLRIRLNSMQNLGPVLSPGSPEPTPPVPPAPAAPKEGDTKPIPNFPGTEQTYRNGKWIRTK